MKYDYIAQGDCLELMKTLPNNSIDCIITSPPYFNLRNYEVENQIGLESSINEYIGKLVQVFTEAHRILKPTGSLWLNVDDVYAKKKTDGIKQHSLMCIPNRLKIRLIDSGWICRNEVIWKKPNAMPSSAKNRFNNDYEKFYFFVKSNDYVFNTQYEPSKSVGVKNATTEHKSSKYQNVKQESSVRQGMNRSRGSKLVALRKNLPSQDMFVNFIRSRTDIDTICENSDLKRTTVEHWFRKDKAWFAFPKVDAWNSVKWLVDDFSEEFMTIDEQLNDITYETDDILKNISKGRIKRTVWEINTKAFKGYHYAPYPEDLVITPILACTNEGDVVLDPFSGSGTTAVVAMKHNRHYIGFDINADYCDLATRRIKEHCASVMDM